jgi:hypothetical protein
MIRLIPLRTGGAQKWNFLGRMIGKNYNEKATRLSKHCKMAMTALAQRRESVQLRAEHFVSASCVILNV